MPTNAKEHILWDASRLFSFGIGIYLYFHYVNRTGYCGSEAIKVVAFNWAGSPP
jgi:hypothetical protein